MSQQIKIGILVVILMGASQIMPALARPYYYANPHYYHHGYRGYAPYGYGYAPGGYGPGYSAPMNPALSAGLGGLLGGVVGGVIGSMAANHSYRYE